MRASMPPDKLKAYLLGTLEGPEREELERAFLDDDEAYEELRAAEDDLIDAAVRGELTGDERQRFDTLFLADPERRERVRTARVLHAASATPRRARYLPEVMAAAVAVAAVVFMFVRPAGESVMTARLAAPTRGVVAPVIDVGGADQVRLELELPAGTEAGGLGVRVRRIDGGWVTGAFEPGPPPTVVLHAAELPPGSYEIELLRGEETLGFYRFSVGS